MASMNKWITRAGYTLILLGLVFMTSFANTLLPLLQTYINIPFVSDEANACYSLSPHSSSHITSIILVVIGIALVVVGKSRNNKLSN
jgi:uncharacterized membrane protein